MKKIKFIFVLLLFIGNLPAQNMGEIQGTVTSKIDKSPAMFSTVTVSNAATSQSVLTDENGKFKIKALISGTYNIKIVSVEYGSLSMKDIQVTPDNITFLNTLELVGNSLEAIDIVWHKDLIKKDNPALISIRTIDIKHSANSKSPISLVSQLPGITKGDGHDLYFRGSRPQSISTYVDGVRLITGSLNSVPSNAVKSINVYTGGVPASYGDITGGVIVLETKSYMDFYKESP